MHVRGVMGKRKANSEARMRKSRKRARALESVVQYGTVQSVKMYFHAEYYRQMKLLFLMFIPLTIPLH